MAIGDTQEDKLAKYIVGDLFDWFKTERKNQLEDQMIRNYDAFRGKYDSAQLKKWRATEGKDWRSRVFVRITKQKTVAGFNQVAPIVIDGNNLRWDMTPSSIPEKMKGMRLPVEEAKARSALMKKQIKDDFIEGKITEPALSSVLEMALYGWGWIYGPVLRRKPVININFDVPGNTGLYFNPEIMAEYGRHSLSVNYEYKLMTENPGVWNVFWDLENADHNKGHGIIIRDMMSKGRLLDLADMPGYDKKVIQKIYDEYKGSKDSGGEEINDSEAPSLEDFSKRKRVIPLSIFHGRVPRQYLREYQKKTGNEIRGLDFAGAREVEIQCVCIGGRRNPEVVKPPVINPLPYRRLHLAKWEELPGESKGVGVPENMEDSQMIVNGLMRAMLDNKALSSNLMAIMKPQNLAPGQNKSMYPGKIFEAHELVEDVRNAMYWWAPPDITGNTPKLIEMGKQFADEETGLPKTFEGQRLDSRTTAYEVAKITESGGKLVGGTVRNHDHGHTQPLVTAYYHWHMLANPDESIKGDYRPEAKGTQSYIEKVEKAQNILELFSLAVSSAASAQFTKVLEFLRQLASAKDLDPDKLFPTDEELQNNADEIARLLPRPEQPPVMLNAPQ